MINDLLKLSEKGKTLFDEAVKKTKQELKEYERIRTCCYYQSKGKKEIEKTELRQFISEIAKEFRLNFSFDERESDYFFFLNDKFFDLLGIKIHRLHPNNYVIVTQKSNGQPVFIIRDHDDYEEYNVKIKWNNEKMEDAELEKVPLYISKTNLIH
jgi:hypothetical protein